VHGHKAEAGIHPPAVDVHRAGAALAVVATLLGAGQVQMVTQAVQQRGAGVQLQRFQPAVDLHAHGDGAIRCGRALADRGGGHRVTGERQAQPGDCAGDPHHLQKISAAERGIPQLGEHRGWNIPGLFL
jgi:hypothetical protein